MTRHPRPGLLVLVPPPATLTLSISFPSPFPQGFPHLTRKQRCGVTEGSSSTERNYLALPRTSVHRGCDGLGHWCCLCHPTHLFIAQMGTECLSFPGTALSARDTSVNNSQNFFFCRTLFSDNLSNQ